MKLTNAEIDMLKILIQEQLKEIDRGPEGIEIYCRPEILINLDKKLDSMYFQ